MTISPRFATTTALLLALAAVGCSSGGDDDGAAPPANGSVTDSTGSADPSAGPVEPTGGGQGNGEQPPEVGSVLQGIAVAGNAGGTGSSDGGPGETEPYSQTIRFEDGTCRGWTPEDESVPSTEGLEAGASVTIRNDAGEEIGGGSVESSTSFPVDESGNRIDEDQGTATWRCEFFFRADLTVSQPPSVVFVQVAGLDPWAASPDSSGQFVAIVPGAPGAPTGGTTTVSPTPPSGAAPDTTPPSPETTPPTLETTPPLPDTTPPLSVDVTTPTS